GDHFVGVMSVGGDVAVGVAGSAKGECAETVGRSVAQAAMKNAGKDCAPNYFYMVASPGEEESYLKGITDVIGRVPFFGGSAADNSISGEWSLFADEMVTGDGVAVAFFYTAGRFANKYTGAYGESGKSGVITKVSGSRCLVEIDGVPAIKKYAEWSGKDVEQLKGGNLLVETICNPLGVKDRLGDLVAIRHPMFGNDDLSMNIGSDLSVNTAVIYMEGSVDKLIKSNSETLETLKEKLPGAKGYFLVHCGGRRAGIGDRIEEAVAEIKKAAGDVPFLCEFTFGEYGFEKDGNNTCGGLMLSFTAFGD
ncbi:MAG: FIST C-terminal domain-containing protein, partial [Clostridiales bacterium]|nr:FIST C-terminal domain-containing protein [Clostridiales bacterium]